MIYLFICFCVQEILKNRISRSNKPPTDMQFCEYVHAHAANDFERLACVLE